VLHAHLVQREPAKVEARAPQAPGHKACAVTEKTDAPACCCVLSHPSSTVAHAPALTYQCQKPIVARLRSNRPTGVIAQEKNHENPSLSATGCCRKLILSSCWNRISRIVYLDARYGYEMSCSQLPIARESARVLWAQPCGGLPHTLFLRIASERG